MTPSTISTCSSEASSPHVRFSSRRDRGSRQAAANKCTLVLVPPAPLPDGLSNIPVGGTADYPPGAFVSTTIKPPYRGRIAIQDQRLGPSTVLWECQHDHPEAAEAFACAGQEIGRDGKT
jgi:hypothetical protein